MVQTRGRSIRKTRNSSTLRTKSPPTEQSTRCKNVRWCPKELHMPSPKVTLSGPDPRNYDNDYPPLSSPQKQPPSTQKKIDTPATSPLLTPNRCCDCSYMSGCKTKRCPCFVASRPCTNCNGRACKSNSLSPGSHKHFLIPRSCCTDDNRKHESSTLSPHAKRFIPADNHNTPPSDNTSKHSTQTPPSESSTPPPDDDNGSISPTPDKDEPDLPGYIVTDVDRKLQEVYGDYIHQNDGSHLDGGIADDAF